MFARSDLVGDLSEVQVHRLGVAGGQDGRSSLALTGADRAEDIGGSGALIVRRRGPRAASCPVIPCRPRRPESAPCRGLQDRPSQR